MTGPGSTRLAARLITACLLLTILGLATSGSSTTTAADWRADWGTSGGFGLSIDAGGFEFPSAMVFVPNPGSDPQDPLYFVTELRGRVKVVTNARTIHTFAEGLFTLAPPRELPAPEGETGLAGICLAPEQGYVFVTFAYQDPRSVLRNGIVRLQSRPGTFSLESESSRPIGEILATFESALSHQIGGCQVHDGMLYVSVADGRQTVHSRQVDSVLGKVLRMDLDGAPVPSNPFYDPNETTRPQNFVWAYGLRNPFGIKIVDGRVFVADNGRAIDRFLEIGRGEDYLWTGSDWSIGSNARAILSPSVGPVQVDFHHADLALLPEKYRSAFFVATSAPQSSGVLMLPYDLPTGRMRTAPEFIVRYRGSGAQAVAGLALGPDGLYFTPIMPQADGRGAVLKLTYRPNEPHPFGLLDVRDPAAMLREKGCLGCHSLQGVGGRVATPLDRDLLTRIIRARLDSPEYTETVRQVDALDRAPFTDFAEARRQVQAARGDEQIRLWTKYRLLEPRFDNPFAQMPNLGLSEAEADTLAAYLVGSDQARTNLWQQALERVLPVHPERRHLLMYLAMGGLSGALGVGLLWGASGRIRSIAGRWMRTRRLGRVPR